MLPQNIYPPVSIYFHKQTALHLLANNLLNNSHQELVFFMTILLTFIMSKNVLINQKYVQALLAKILLVFRQPRHNIINGQEKNVRLMMIVVNMVQTVSTKPAKELV